MQFALHKYRNINRTPNVFYTTLTQMNYFVQCSGDHWFSSWWFMYALLAPGVGDNHWTLQSLPPGGNSELYLDLQDFCSEMSLEHHPLILGFWIWSCPGQNVFSHLKAVVRHTHKVLNVIYLWEIRMYDNWDWIKHAKQYEM